MPEHLPRTPIHVFGESLCPQPLDHEAREASHTGRWAALPFWARAILAGFGLLAACVAPLLFAGFLFFLLITS